MRDKDLQLLEFIDVVKKTINGVAQNDANWPTSFAQISNDGRWALFSSYWDGTLGAAAGDFGFSKRIDTFIVELR